MSGPPIDEIFSGVTLTVDITKFQRTDKASHILNGYDWEDKKSTYEVKGSFKDIEDVFWKLSSLKRLDAPKYQTDANQDYSTPTQVGDIEVVDTVMDYINQKYSKELNKIVGDAVSMQYNRASNKSLVSFRPLHRGKDIYCCHFARERFITFYQKIATNLLVRTFPLDPALKTRLKSIQLEFPKLLISSDSHRLASTSSVSVTGSYADVSRLDEFLKSGAMSYYQLPRHQTQQPQTASASASASSRAQSPQQEKEEACPICLETVKDKKTLSRCQHSFCRDCLDRAFESKPTCPICGAVYGHLTGTQPRRGTMEVSTNASSLPGNIKHGTIVIRYHIPGGIQGEEHPNPGHRYEGASRTAFLPDSPEGRSVLKLLQRAFDQRLIFTIGQSSTSGRTNVVTWNDIHHKTNREGGPTNYGYPDPDYLARVQEELKAKGIY
ncbi:E3 ubiquitin-protein ligase DTX3L isoform X2 [Megalops cyprinoides]|uniref:E3 ubiquitin-protein ligase DTX3L isoform X2 n=1 Tax=Megalops cyprinoides TaxID=118141 RepID=UPI001864CF93|nr:E3 ubiquitin-protein ligase DTX3L isoform X2 [Megalops cyprinoides]